MTARRFRDELSQRCAIAAVRPPVGAQFLGLGRLLVLLCVTVTLTSAAGCYRPSITEGGLMCAATNPPCPDGFSCLGGRCHHQGQGDASAPPDSVIDRSGTLDATGDADAGAAKDSGADVAADADAAMCVPRQALDGCTPNAGLACDPVCQTGCCTDEKCTALNSGPASPTVPSLGCSKMEATRKAGDTCDVTNAGTETRSDNCLAGLLCVTGNADSICFQLCRSDLDCSGDAKCEMRPIEPASTHSAAVCGLPSSKCTPTAPAACSDRRTCYLIPDANGSDRTVCDITSGTKNNAASCTYSFECLPGWTCPAAGPGAGRCQAVCAHTGTSVDCPRSFTCQASGNEYDLCL